MKFRTWTHHDKVNQRHSIERNIPYVHEAQEVDNNHGHCKGHNNSYTQAKSQKNESDNKDGGWKKKENSVRNFKARSRNVFDLNKKAQYIKIITTANTYPHNTKDFAKYLLLL